MQIMTWHEIANDTVGGVPATITFCPLCTLRSPLIGRSTKSSTTPAPVATCAIATWSCGTVRQSPGGSSSSARLSWGNCSGQKLKLLPATVISWNDFKEAYPEGKVLSRDTGFRRDYGRNPYAGYDRVDLPPFLYFGEPDGRLLPKERVAAVSIEDIDVAFPFSVLEKEHVVNYSTNGLDMAVFFTPDTRSALDDDRISQARSVGATGILRCRPQRPKADFPVG